jgi:antitoxin VapB
MPLSIRNPRAEQLAREVAAESGESMTQAVIHALEEQLQRIRGRRVATDLFDEIMAVSSRCRALPDQDVRSAEEILGYDNNGVPR